MFKNKYRVVRDTYCGYEAQVKFWWMPFYIQIDLSNTHTTVEGAKDLIAKHKQNRQTVYQE